MFSLGREPLAVGTPPPVWSVDACCWTRLVTAGLATDMEIAMTDDAQAIYEDLDALERFMRDQGPVYLRYSQGFEADADSGSMDTESGLSLPGLSVNPLTPEPWWTRPLTDWLARQICQYKHLDEKQDRHAWILTGKCVGRGPDCEPLLTNVRPLGRLSRRLLEEAERVYEDRFSTGGE
jgi:hypothetical protein